MKYIEGTMNYTGSKFKLLEQIIPKMDFSKEMFMYRNFFIFDYIYNKKNHEAN